MKYGIVSVFFLFINFGCSQIPSKPMLEIDGRGIKQSGFT